MDQSCEPPFWLHCRFNAAERAPPLLKALAAGKLHRRIQEEVRSQMSINPMEKGLY